MGGNRSAGDAENRDKMSKVLNSSIFLFLIITMVDTAQISIEMCSVALSHQPSQEFVFKSLTLQSWKSRSSRK